MPLSKKRMKERKRQDRLVKPSTPALNLVKPNKQEKLARLRLLMSNLVKPKTDALQSKSSPLKEESNSRIPLYDRLDLYRAGIEPPLEIDADGNLIPDY